MDLFLISLLGYALFVYFDLVPRIQQKEKKTLFFSIPVYLITFILSMMIDFGVELPSVNESIKQLIITIFHMQ